MQRRPTHTDGLHLPTAAFYLPGSRCCCCAPCDRRNGTHAAGWRVGCLHGWCAHAYPAHPANAAPTPPAQGRRPQPAFSRPHHTFGFTFGFGLPTAPCAPLPCLPFSVPCIVDPYWRHTPSSGCSWFWWWLLLHVVLRCYPLPLCRRSCVPVTSYVHAVDNCVCAHTTHTHHTPHTAFYCYLHTPHTHTTHTHRTLTRRLRHVAFLHSHSTGWTTFWCNSPGCCRTGSSSSTLPHPLLLLWCIHVL